MALARDEILEEPDGVTPEEPFPAMEEPGEPPEADKEALPPDTPPVKRRTFAQKSTTATSTVRVDTGKLDVLVE